ncbi:hypothetical protein [Sulfurospirillum sp. UCH001]|uniref:hypothetical protein n=1 Tax=Sulfurospirillum sp. UCH001 TaxID=1581011 RepID=UPI0008321CF4|nr:hypothetical protein [Sulfurospirillum sp. UCH001]
MKHSTIFSEALLLDKRTIKKATQHYFLERNTVVKYSCINLLAQEWNISILESFTYLMLHRACFRYGAPITLQKLCKILQIEKKKFSQQLRLMLYLRFAEKRGLIIKHSSSCMKISPIAYHLKNSK